MSTFMYDRGDTLPAKHVSDNDVACFVQVGREMIGKCPRGISESDRDELLKNPVTVPENGLGHRGVPDALYAVIDGVPYTTKWTNFEQRSLHGFPWAMRGNRRMPPRVQRVLAERAEKNGNLDRFEAWMKKYGRNPLRAPQ